MTSKSQTTLKNIQENKSFAEKLSTTTKYQFILIIVLAFIFYGNTIKNDYSLDDVYVTNNKMIKKGFKAIPTIFRTTYASVFEDGEQMNFGYRPIVKVSFAIESQFFGSNPHVSHFMNILLYILSCLLLLIILKNLLYNYHPLFPLLITVLFLAHPIHTEVVSSLKNRDELLSFLFSLMSLYCFIKFTDKNNYWFLPLAFVCFVLGFLSKISCLVYLVIIPLIIYFFKQTKFRNLLIIFFILAIAVIISRHLNHVVITDRYRPKLFIENPLIFEKNLLIRLSTGFFILMHYLKLELFPNRLLFYYGYNTIPIVGWANIIVIFSVIIHLAGFIFAIIKLKSRHILSFAILFYLVNMSMYMNVLNPPMGIVADRFLYSSILAFCIFLVWLIFKINKMVPTISNINQSILKKTALITMVLLLPYGVRTITRNNQWKNQQSLLQHDMLFLENSAKANYIYAGTLHLDLMNKLQSGNRNFNAPDKISEILKYLNQALYVYPAYYQANNFKGQIYFSLLRQPDTAEKYFNLSLASNPFYMPGYFNLAYLKLMKKDTTTAISYFEKVIAIKPDNPQANHELSKIYLMKHDSAKSVYYEQKSIQRKKQRRGFKRRKETEENI